VVLFSPLFRCVVLCGCVLCYPLCIVQEMLLKQSTLDGLQKELEEWAHVVAHLEEQVQTQEKDSKDINRTFGEVQSAIENLSALIENWTDDKEEALQSGATTIKKKQRSTWKDEMARSEAAAVASANAPGGSAAAKGKAAALTEANAAAAPATLNAATLIGTGLNLTTAQALAERRRADGKTQTQLLFMLRTHRQRLRCTQRTAG
jgi:hypothetical protein